MFTIKNKEKNLLKCVKDSSHILLFKKGFTLKLRNTKSVGHKKPA